MGARRPGGDRAPRAAGSARELKCTNCGGPHRIEACTKPKLAISDRPCWTCGKKHLNKDCPDNPRNKDKAKPGVRTVTQGPDDIFLVRERRKSSPRTVHLADFLPRPALVKNSFNALATEDIEELNNKKETGKMTQVSTASLESVPTSRMAKHLSVRQIKARMQQERIEAENKKFFVKPDPMELIEIVGNIDEEILSTVGGATPTFANRTQGKGRDGGDVFGLRPGVPAPRHDTTRHDTTTTSS